MGLILGIAICILSLPVGFFALLMTSDWETGLQKSSPWMSLVPVLGLNALGALMIYSHSHSIW